MNTNFKYTVIISAYHTDNSALDNMLNTEKLAHTLARNIGCTATPAVGVYEGTPEQSFVIHTNSSNTVNRLVDEGVNGSGQICVLVSNNRKNLIQLHNADGTRDTIGARFISSIAAPKNARAYTYVNGEYWTVA